MLNLLVAPKTYAKQAERHAKRVVGFLKSKHQDYSVYFSQDLDEFKENINYLTSFGENEFAIIGDDRMIGVFVNQIKDLSKIKFGIIPTSKKDDFASYLGLHSNPILAIKEILKRHIENVDMLMCNGIRVVNNVVIGASVDMYEAYNKFKWKNVLLEKILMIKYSKAYQSKKLKIDLKNSKTRTEDVFELIVANGGNSKTKKLSPLSNVKDGLFNLIYVLEPEKKSVAKSIKSIFEGKHVYKDQTIQLWGSELKLTSENQNIKAMLDGEVYDLERIEINLIEGALKIFK